MAFGTVLMLALYALAGALYGAASLLAVARTGVGDPNAGQTENLDAITAVVLGGTSLFGGEGGIGRTVIGVLTLSVLRVGLDKISWIDNFLRTFLLGVVLLGALVLNGFLARRRRTT